MNIAALLLLGALFLLIKKLQEDTQVQYDYVVYYFPPESQFPSYTVESPKSENTKANLNFTSSYDWLFKPIDVSKISLPDIFKVDMPDVFVIDSPNIKREETAYTPIPKEQAYHYDYIYAVPEEYQKVFRYYNYALEAYRQLRIPPSLILAVIRVESSGNPRAVGSAGEIGLMQILPRTAFYLKELGYPCPIRKESDLFDPYVNIMCGTSYLAYLRDRVLGYYDPWLIAYGYNAGEGNLRKYLAGTRTVSRSVDYANKVTYHMSQIERFMA